MRRPSLASIATAITFLAFAFELIGAITVPPVTRKLALASYESYSYGTLGYCPTDSSKPCSSVGVGYSLKNEAHWYLPSGGQHILSQILVAHIVAAGCLLISLVLVGAAHVESHAYRLSAAILFVPVCLVTVLVFVVEIVLFGTNLNFAGWFSLPAMVLSVAVTILLFLNASASNSGSQHGSGTIELSRGGSFVIGPSSLDDEKQPMVVQAQPQRFDRLGDAKLGNWNGQDSSQLGGRNRGYIPPVIMSNSDSDGSLNKSSAVQRPQQRERAVLKQGPRTVPAGTYIPGTDTAKGEYGPGVVKIPTVRNAKPETTQAQRAQTNATTTAAATAASVPNYSRTNMSVPSSAGRPMAPGVLPVAPPHQSRNTGLSPQQNASEKSATAQYRPQGPSQGPAQTYVPQSQPQSMQPMQQQHRQQQLDETRQALVEQYVSSTTAASGRNEYYEPAPQRFIPPPSSPATSDSSHYTSVSQRGPAWTTPSQPPHLQYAPAANGFGSANNYQLAANHAPTGNYSSGQTGAYNNIAPHQQMRPMPQVMPMGYAVPQAPAQPDRSELAIDSNPDFAVAGLPSRRRRNRPF